MLSDNHLPQKIMSDRRPPMTRTIRSISSPSGSTRVFALTLLLAVAACESEPRPVEDLNRVGDLWLDAETGEPFSGVAFSTFHDRPGVVSQRLTLRNGTYDGPFEAYFANQTLSSKELYQGGRKHGRYERYFENGQLFEEGTYTEGRRTGPYRAYWESGALYEEGMYEDGRFHGPRRWYLEGRLVELVTYQHGVMEGLYERYREDGELALKGMLRAGNPCGLWIENDEPISYPSCRTAITD